MFHVKAVHLAAQRVGRVLLRNFRKVGMTPARFDLMNALGHKGARQSDLWRQLNVVRSVVCEMVRSLRALGWVKRVRAADGRTWLVQPTRRGREVFERASAECVENGEATLHMDAGLVEGHLELDALRHRNELIHQCAAIERTYRVGPCSYAPEIYPWHPEDYWTWLTEYDDPTGTEEIPFADQIATSLS